MNLPGEDEVTPRLIAYARAFLSGYCETIDRHFQDPKAMIAAAGLTAEYFPLYGRELGVNLAIAVFYTQGDFYLFFLDKEGTEIEIIMSAVAQNTNEFGIKWMSDTPKKQ